MNSQEWRKIPLLERLEMQTDKTHPSGCHIYTGAKDSKGYGVIKNNGAKLRVNRLLWELHNSTPAPDIHVLHKCDTPACCNPDHLFLGTHADNMRDKALKGRGKGINTGVKHTRPNAKLDEKQVLEIRELLARGYRQIDIAADYGVSKNIICDINLHHTWRHI